MSRKIEVENLRKYVTPEMEDKHFHNFSKRASYAGNGIYCISGLYSTDTRELFLMFVAQQEGLKVNFA